MTASNAWSWPYRPSVGSSAAQRWTHPPDRITPTASTTCTSSTGRLPNGNLMFQGVMKHEYRRPRPDTHPHRRACDGVGVLGQQAHPTEAEPGTSASVREYPEDRDCDQLHERSTGSSNSRGRRAGGARQ